MAWLSLLRDNELLSADMLARIIGSGGGALGNIYDATLPPGIGTGAFTVGVVGKMNGTSPGTDPDHLRVTANNTNLTLTVRPGWMWLRRDAGTTTFDPRCSFVELTASQTVTLASNNQGSTRVDQVCLRYDLTTPPDSTGSNIPSLFVVQGGAASALGAAPSDAGTGALYVVLATVQVNASATSVSQANVTDKRYAHPSQLKLRAHRSSDVTVSTGVFVMDTVDTDFCGMYSAAAGTYTITTPGYYRVDWGMWLSSTGASGNAQTTTRVNGADQYPGMMANMVSGVNWEMTGSAIARYSQGDAVGPGSPGAIPATATLHGDQRYSFFTLHFVSF